MRHGASATIVGRKYVPFTLPFLPNWSTQSAEDATASAEHGHFRLDRLEQTAKELSEATGGQCLAAQADVRNPTNLKEAVAKTIEKFGRIDFVICGRSLFFR